MAKAEMDVKELLKSAFIEGYLRTGGNADNYPKCEKEFEKWYEGFLDDVRASVKAPKETSVTISKFTVSWGGWI